MTIAALVFGSLGTLTETSELHRQAFNDTFAEEGLDWSWDDATYRSLLDHVGGANRILAYAGRQPGGEERPPAWAAEIHARKTARYAELVRSTDLRLRPGVERLLAEARSAGLRVGLATGTSVANIDASLTATGNRLSLDDFDAHTVRDMIEHPKPAPDAHRRCVELLGVDPATAMAVEDSTDGVASAREAGLFVVATPGDFVRSQDFSAAGVVLSDLGDPGLPGQRLDGGPEPADGVATLEWLAAAVGLGPLTAAR